MAVYETTGFIRGGRLHVRKGAGLTAALARWKDGEVLITIERAHAIRSLESNSLYWVGYVKPLSEHIGEPPRWVHAYLKKRFLPPKHLLIQDKNGVVVDEVDLDMLTTTKLNTVEFSEYLHEIQVWAATDLGVMVGSNRENRDG
jgi:hypothetical protein